MKINLRRGIFRLWVIFAGVFAIATGVLSANAIRIEFRKASEKARLPVSCEVATRLARGNPYSDYSEHDGWCWFEISKFRELYPEYKGVPDEQLLALSYKKASLPLAAPRPWAKVLEMAEVGLGIPAAVLVLGYSLAWAVAGFNAKVQ